MSEEREMERDIEYPSSGGRYIREGEDGPLRPAPADEPTPPDGDKATAGDKAGKGGKK